MDFAFRGLLAQVGAMPLDAVSLNPQVSELAIGSGATQDAEVWSQGLAIASVGLLIVFSVLVLLSLFITALPHLISLIEPVFPAVDHSHADHNRAGGDHPQSQLPDDTVLAAIGFVLHSEIQAVSQIQKNSENQNQSAVGNSATQTQMGR